MAAPRPGERDSYSERDAELAQLQAAFDEYIASSRELEEELDAELAKMQEKLAESSAANAALSMQLENIAPQLTSLENSLTESRRHWKEEQKLRRQAEQAEEASGSRMRELEGKLFQMQGEMDILHEELAFKESELEETKMELEIEKEQLRGELEDIRADLIAKAQQLQSQQQDQSQGASKSNVAVEDSFSRAAGDKMLENMDDGDDYAKKLEEELELVTEQLIEREKQLNLAEEKLQVVQASNDKLAAKQKTLDDEFSAETEKSLNLLKALQQENADHLEARHKLAEELELTKQRNELLEKSLQASEENQGDILSEVDKARHDHRDEVHKMELALKEMEMEAKAARKEVVIMEKSLQDNIQNYSRESSRLNEEIANLNQALINSKQDYQAVLDELEAVSSRFDEALVEAQRTGREAANLEVRQESEAKISQIKEEFQMLARENQALQSQLDDAEMTMSQVKDTQDKNIDNALAQTEMVKKVQQQLVRAKEDLAAKDKEMSGIVSNLEDRLSSAEQMVSKLEQELATSKGKLAEADARLIVLRREKDGKATPSATKVNRQKLAEYGDITEEESRDDDIMRHRVSNATEGRRRRRARSSSPSSVQSLKYRLSEEEKKLKSLQRECDAMKDQKRMAETQIKRLEEDLQALQRQIISGDGSTSGPPVAVTTTQMSRISTLANQEKGMDVITDEEVGKGRLEDIMESGDFNLMGQELQNLHNKCNAQREYNVQLLSRMLQLQGNIQVYCRIRPMTISEIQKGYKQVVEALSETEIGCHDKRTNKWKSFAFDRVWGADQSQQVIFQDVEPVALSVVDGYNACIFAYGQTGSGKTYTMEGVEAGNQRGISYRTIQKIFHLLKLRKQQQRAADLIVGQPDAPENDGKPMTFNFSIELSMLEIYNEDVYDLLSSESSSLAAKQEASKTTGGKASLELRKTKDGRIEVPNAVREPVNSMDDVITLLNRGNGNRAVAATDLNEHSSRSHMVLMVHVHSGLDGVSTNKGTLFLVDLAGSERVRKSNVGGDQLREAGFINKSLSALGNVMEALDRKASHVPYRDSKLTFLLQGSLGGNSRTMMISTVCPVDVAYDESVHALQFATRVRRIQIGAAQRNVTSKNLEETVKMLTQEMKALASAKERTETQLQSLKRDNTRIQDRLQGLNQQRKESRADTRTLDVLRKNNTDMAARWQKEKRIREETSEELEKARKELSKVQKQLSKKARETEVVEAKLQETESKLERAFHDLRLAKDASSAAAHRARRAQVLSARGRKVPDTMVRNVPNVVVDVTPDDATESVATMKTNKTGDTTEAVIESVPSKAEEVTDMTGNHDGAGDSASTAKPNVSEPAAPADATAIETDKRQPAPDDSAEEHVDVQDDVTVVRGKVLALLEKYDQGKVDRIDIIMEKFRGKEHLLLQKMTQRYEGAAAGAAVSASPSVQKRSELAMARHKERMRIIREKQNAGG